MKKITEDILKQFAAHEGLSFPKVKFIFQSSTPNDQAIQLKDMKKVIKRQFIKSDAVRSSLGLATTSENKKDE